MVVGRQQTRRLLRRGIRSCTRRVSRHASISSTCRWTTTDLSSGKTTEAKSDMARLQEVRRRREAAAAQRQAEADGKSHHPVNLINDLLADYLQRPLERLRRRRPRQTRGSYEKSHDAGLRPRSVDVLLTVTYQYPQREAEYHDVYRLIMRTDIQLVSSFSSSRYSNFVPTW